MFNCKKWCKLVLSLLIQVEVHLASRSVIFSMPHTDSNVSEDIHPDEGIDTHICAFIRVVFPSIIPWNGNTSRCSVQFSSVTQSGLSWIFVRKVMSLLFNMLSRLMIAFLPSSKRLLILWLQSPSAVILEPKKTKSVTVSIVSPSICHQVMGPMPWSSFFECWALSQLFYSPFHPHQGALKFFCTFCHESHIMCISEVVDISSSDLDSSFWFI